MVLQKIPLLYFEEASEKNLQYRVFRPCHLTKVGITLLCMIAQRENISCRILCHSTTSEVK